MLTVVAFRNLIELGGSEVDFTEGFVLPQSFGWFGHNVIWTISSVRVLHVCLPFRFANDILPMCSWQPAGIDSYGLRNAS